MSIIFLFLLIVTGTLLPSTSFAAVKASSKVMNEALIFSKLPSSAIFPIYGDVYPHGLYYVSMSIGDPAKPYFLDVDTGSDLTWLQCDAPCVSCSKGPHPFYKPKKNGLIKCGDEMCESVPSVNHGNDCESSDQCDYEIEYADRLSSLGVLVSDVFVLRLTNNFLVKPKLALGCGYDQQQISDANSPSPTDGVLGLGSGKASIISQLKNQGITQNIFGHCLSRKKGGYLFFGDDLVPSHGVSWAPMSFITSRNYYSPGKARFYLGKQSLVIKPVPVVFDSGSSYTYFTDNSYKELLLELENDLSNKPLKRATEDQSLPVCWKGVKPFKSLIDVKKLFRSLVLYFGSGSKAVQLEILPENYLIVTKYGNACLGILDGTEIGLKDLNIIGDITMQDMMVIYDNEKRHIGWVQMNCDRLPNAEDEFSDYEKSFSKSQLD